MRNSGFFNQGIGQVAELCLPIVHPDAARGSKGGCQPVAAVRGVAPLLTLGPCQGSLTWELGQPGPALVKPLLGAG